MKTYITITRRTDDFHAAIAGDARIWDCGKTQAEAVGNLIMSHPDKFTIVVNKSR